LWCVITRFPGNEETGRPAWPSREETEILAISTEKLRPIGPRQVGGLVSLACVPKLDAPNGRVVLPGPGIGDEVNTIDANSPSARDAAPQRPVFEGTAFQGANPPDQGANGVARGEGGPVRHRPHARHPHQLQQTDEITGIESRSAGQAAKAAAKAAPEADREAQGDAQSEPAPVIIAESIIAAEAAKNAGSAMLGPGTAELVELQSGGRPHGPRDVFRIARELVTRTYRRGVEIELMHRAFGFAALGFVTLVPLLIVVAAAAPLNGRSFPAWAIAGLGLSGRAASAVNGLFGPAARVLSTTTALSAAVLAVFGLSFVSVVQTGMARVWELPAARLLSVWRQAIWLAVLIGLLIVGADLLAFLHDGWFITTLRWCATAGGALTFFWWTQHFLLESRVPWRALLPGAVLTVAGLVGLRIFSAVIFGPLIVSSAITYGAIGAVLIVVSWLIGIGYVIFGAALLGRVIYEAFGGERK
jgi:membrane protein